MATPSGSIRKRKCIRKLISWGLRPVHADYVRPDAMRWTSGSVEIPLGTRTGNSSSIGEEPVPYGIPTIRRSTTSSLVSYAEQGIMTFTNVLQDHDTVVLVCCISEWEPDITCTWEDDESSMVYYPPFLLMSSQSVCIILKKNYLVGNWD